MNEACKENGGGSVCLNPGRLLFSAKHVAVLQREPGCLEELLEVGGLQGLGAELRARGRKVGLRLGEFQNPLWPAD